MLDTWVREESARQFMEFDAEPDINTAILRFAEDCVRAGLLEAARRLEVHAVSCYHESAEGDSACFTWMDRHRDAARYAVELCALAGEEPRP